MRKTSPSSSSSTSMENRTAGNDTFHLYDTLGVKKSATPQEIKKAYFRLSKMHHPDKGGDEQTFQEISAAYQVLSDVHQRKKYDIFGVQGLQDAPTAGADVFNVFATAGTKQHHRTPSSSSSTSPRAGDVNHTLPLTLEELYNGKVFKMAVTRTTFANDAATPCDSCNGVGMVMQIRRLGNGAVQQTKCQCPACHGTGSQEGLRQKERKIVEVTVEKGMAHGERIVFPGLGDDQPHHHAHKTPGNLNIIVKEKDHAVFKRKGADLLIRKTLTLNEALTGFSFVITHLDQRKVVVKSKPGEIISPLGPGGKGAVKMIPNEGMPSRGNPFLRGNLYVHFSVKFPTDGELSNDVLTTLRMLLPGRPPEVSDDEAQNAGNVVHTTYTDIRNFGKGGMAYSDTSSDSDESVPEGVQCQQS